MVYIRLNSNVNLPVGALGLVIRAGAEITICSGGLKTLVLQETAKCDWGHIIDMNHIMRTTTSHQLFIISHFIISIIFLSSHFYLKNIKKT